MFAGFDLKWDLVNNYENYTLGLNDYNGNKRRIEQQLAKFIQSDGSLDGTKMRDNWFPQINADIFISHSHADKEKAIAFAGWLTKTFGLKVFIDSCVWGFADDLLWQIDNKYCKNSDGYFSYEIRNYSTSHVHMMLSTALTMMMDKVECLFFMNTPNSVDTENAITQTKSPWIYLEIAMTKLIRKRQPEREKVLIKKGFFEANAELTIKYNLDLDHLPKISLQDMHDWAAVYDKQKKTSLEIIHPLDLLYKKYGFIHDLEIINEVG